MLYEIIYCLLTTFISADSLKAVDNEPSNRVSLELFIQYPNVAWNAIHRERFEGLTDARKGYFFNMCDAEKCAALLSNDQFHFLHTCSMEEFKNLLHVVKDFLSRTAQESLVFLHLNDDALNDLRWFSSSRIVQFTSNPEVFPSILRGSLNYFLPPHDNQFNNVLKFYRNGIKALQRFFPEHI